MTEKVIKTKSESHMIARGAPPTISDNMAKSVSQWRKDELERQVERGEFRDGNTPAHMSGGLTAAGTVTHSTSMRKYAETGALSSGASFRGAGGTVRQVPEVYSPLWLNSNLNLPRDRATANAWSRAFFALNPFVQNALMLHATYPISKLNIRCKNKKVESFFAEMAEEIDLMNVCVQIAQEYWTLGEAFIYAELDESSAKWSRLVIQNPDYITVKRSVIAGEPLISLRPDENLRRVVFSNRPADVQQKRGLDPAIIEHVKRGENIPLNNFYVSHISRKISPYEIRGTGLPVSIFRQLMLFDRLRECYSADTEVLTKNGFKKIQDLVELTSDTNVKGDYVVGASFDDVGDIKALALKDDVEVACYNNKTNQIEYHKPEEMHMSQYNGPMFHFNGKKVDTLVTPNHRMLAAKKSGNEYGRFEEIRASEFEDQSLYKFKATAEWKSHDCDEVEICGKKVPTQLFVQFLGYLLSEGCVYSKLNKKTGYMQNSISISQLTESNAYPFMKGSIKSFAEFMGLHAGEYVKVRGNGFSKHTPKELWEGRITSQEITLYFKNELGINGKSDSKHKRIPRWVLNLDKKYLMILLDALMYGDGSTNKIQQGISYRYSTACKELADDVQEAAFKCGYSPFVSVSQRKTCIEYTVRWSDSVSGREPIIYNNGDKCASINEINYNGTVWCFTIPTDYFITRRNNRISIQGNSKYSQADNLINPITLVKIGDQEFRPSPADLEQYRQIFECHDEETEVLTDQGFKKFDEVIEYAEAMDGTYNQPYISYAQSKQGFKIACFNPDNDELEYHEPSAAHVYNYDGDMYHFHNDKMDIKVTPNHRMWVGQDDKWKEVLAKDLYKNSQDKKFKAVTEQDSIKTINVIDKDIKVVSYSGKVWCFTVPTGLFVTRRNGKTTVQMNSAQYDKDFKIFTHQAVDIQRIGAGQGIYDISTDITQLIKEMYIGLMVPQVLMDGGSDVTYANGGVTLDVLRQRYMQFRNMLSTWLKRKIFAPIAKLNEFYDVVDGKKVLVLPEIDWNHMSLFDAGDYIQAISQLVSAQPKGVSYHTLYRSLGLDWDDEVSKKRIESIQQIIEMKEQEALMQMPLNNLRAIAGKPDVEIKEIIPSPVPGEQSQEQPPQQGMPGVPPMGGMGAPPLGGGMPPAPGGLGGGMPGGGGMPPGGGAPPGGAAPV